MTCVILDTNEIQQDWLCRGLRYQLIQHNPFHPPLQFIVPALVLEELVANHERQVSEAKDGVEASARKLSRLGVDSSAHVQPFDYRAYVCERFDDVLGISILDWPDNGHEELVARAVARTLPFDAKGGGYRDALIWCDVLKLAASGGHVVLVSSDKAFGNDHGLAPVLSAEVERLPGSVELVRDLGTWLLTRLPWAAAALNEAVDRSRDEEFTTWFLSSDFQAELVPNVEAIGIRHAPLEVNILDVTWAGSLVRVDARQAPDGTQLVEFDIDERVEYEATVYAVDIAGADLVNPGKWPGTVSVRDTVDMIVRVGVLFSDDGWGIDELSWRRADGRPPGLPAIADDPNQALLF